MPHTNLPSSLYCMYQMVLIDSEQNERRAQERLEPWAARIVKTCEEYLAEVAFGHDQTTILASARPSTRNHGTMEGGESCSE